MSLLKMLIGRRLANREAEQRKITTLEGLPAIGLDGLSSSAYGPEAALTILAPAGVIGLDWLTPITLAILVVLALLALSYWQTIATYPVNGGSYTVARENLGVHAGLLAATALMIDYMLNVAVGISAGIGALTSAIPALQTYTLPLCLAVLAVIAVANLRGTREAGLVFAAPTYLFIVGLGGIIAYGVWQTIATGGAPTPVTPPPPIGKASEAVTLWLLLRAFASGCTAMTGVEAVSNGVAAFRGPSVKNAHRTLVSIVLTLSVLLAGIALLARAYHIGPMDQTQPGYQSVLSQLAGAIVGQGVVYYVAMGSVLAVLCLSANTSFVDFPRLCRLVAKDGFLPSKFAVPGRRLVNSVGIVWLALGAGALLVAFGGITDRLIPLFAVGAFLAFTLSQAGMTVHWSRQKPEEGGAWGHRVRMAANATGGIATGVSLVVILAAKFLEGAWITVLVIPCFILLLEAIKRYYDRIDRQLAVREPFAIHDHQPPLVIVPLRDWDRLTEKALRYAMRLSPEVVAVHLTQLEGPDAKDAADKLRRRWQDEVAPAAKAIGLPPPPLVEVSSPYRSMVGPLLEFIVRTRKLRADRVIAVVIPEIAKAHWWDYVLHTHKVQRLQANLLREGGPNLAVVLVPWTVDAPNPEKVIAEEGPKQEPASGSASAEEFAVQDGAQGAAERRRG
jgi:amino acid transporter